jgi:hypothetical protein
VLEDLIVPGFIVFAIMILMLFFAPTRALLAFLLGPKGPVAWFLLFLWGSIGNIWKAHLCVARNFLPRNVVRPTLAKRTTKDIS